MRVCHLYGWQTHLCLGPLQTLVYLFQVWTNPGGQERLLSNLQTTHLKHCQLFHELKKYTIIHSLIRRLVLQTTLFMIDLNA